jgi:DNA-binding NarL/FixJ family response regulator
LNGLRVVVAEDHLEVRGIVIGILSQEFEVVDAVGDGEKLVLAAIRHKPEVIVCDIGMPRMDGPAARQHLLSRGITTPFVFITIMDITGLALMAARTAVAYVHKTDMIHELNPAVRAVAMGNAYFSRLFQRAP